MIVDRQDRPAGEDVVLNKFGKGRVAYVPRIVDPAELPPVLLPNGQLDVTLDHTNWRVPDGAEDILAALYWLMGNRPRFEVRARRGVVAEYLHQPRRRRYLAHLINFDVERPARNVHLRMELTETETVAGVQVISPDFPGPRGPGELAWHVHGRALHVTLDSLDIYAVLLIRMRRPA